MAASPVDVKIDAEGKESQLAPAAVWSKEELSRVGSEYPQLVYLVRREGLSPVFASQVVGRMAAVAKAGFSVDIGVMTPLGQWIRPGLRGRWLETVEGLPAVLRSQVWRLPSLPSRFDWPMVEAPVLRWWLGKRLRPHAGKGIGQCRNATVTRMALKARRHLPGLRVVFDSRGLGDHELLYMRGATYETATGKLKRQAQAAGEEQRTSAQEADAIFCVSHAMVDYLEREYGIDSKKCLVVPCCVDAPRFGAALERREHVRQSLGLAGRFVVAYCGDMECYQLPRETLELFRQIRSIEPRAHFLAVTTNPDAMRSVAHEVGVGGGEMTVVSVRHEEVPAYLAAADVGLLLRERSVVNEVASPVKFGEYLASGTPVILSEGIGDYSELARQERVGLVLGARWGAEEIAERLRGFLSDCEGAADEWRRRCRATVERHLEFERYLPAMAAVYRRLQSEPVGTVKGAPAGC